MADRDAAVNGPDPGEILFKQIRKRDGRVVPFEAVKITDAIFKAVQAVGGDNRGIAEELTLQVIRCLQAEGYNGMVPTVEEVQDVVERVLIENGHARTAKAYILYRDRRTRIREAKSELMEVVREILVETSRESTGVCSSPSAKMLQIAMASSKKYYLSNLLPEDSARAHMEGFLHIHDLGYYSKTLNSLQIDPARLLREGFNAGCGHVRPPERLSAATAQVVMIMRSSQNDMFGGQSLPHFDRTMGEVIRDLQERPGGEEIGRAMEELICSLNMVQSGSGAPMMFSSLNLGTDTTAEGRAVTGALLKALNRGLGRGENPPFPSLVFRVKEGINFSAGDPNHDLYRLALEVAARRANPVFSFMDSTFNRRYGDEVAYTGSRLRAINNRHGPEISAGRGNFACTTLNLPRLALENRGGRELFFVELDRLLRLAARQLLHRFGVISRLQVKDLPFLMGQGLYLGSEELGPEDQIGEAIRHSTLAVGFTGLAETLQLLTGKHHGEDEGALQLGLQIADHMYRRCEQLSEEYDLNFVLLGTPAGAHAARFVKADQEHFGVLPGITDQERYSSSFHLPAGSDVSIAHKIAVEGPFHRFCSGGHISYAGLKPPQRQDIGTVDSVVRLMAASDMGCGGLNDPAEERGGHDCDGVSGRSGSSIRGDMGSSNG